MNSPLPIPPDYRTLIGLLRCAVKRTPPEGDLLTAADWPATLRLARQHGVDTYLYPWLAEHAPSLFSAHADVTPDSAPAVWRTLFLEAIPHTLLRQRQLAEILEAFARARIDVIPLKGAWLSETVYDDPVQRSMSDLDLLIRAKDLNACHALFFALGYYCGPDVRNNTFYHDQKYLHHDHPCPVEVHWQFTSEHEPDIAPPDIGAIWAGVSSSRLLGRPVRMMLEIDQLAHLVQHVLTHGFAMPLRGFLDIALCSKRFGDALHSEELDEVAARWKTGRGIPFTLALVSDLLDTPLPPALADLTLPTDHFQRALSVRILFNLPAASDRRSESMLIRLKQAPFAGRIRFIFERLFLPRELLAVIYPCAGRWHTLPLAWAYRFRDLFSRYHNRINFRLTTDEAEHTVLTNAEARASLVNRLLKNEKPGRCAIIRAPVKNKREP